MKLSDECARVTFQRNSLHHMLPAEYMFFLYNVAGLFVKIQGPAQNVW